MRSEQSSEDRVERFRRIYLENYLQILGYALRRTVSPDNAADVVADTFLIVWRRLDLAPPAEGIRPWLYGIARNVMANGDRGERRRARLRARLAAEPGADRTHDAGQLFDVVSEAMQQLSRDDRELLRLAAWEDLTAGQLAVALGCSTNAAKIRLHRARRRLTRKLELLGIRMTHRTRTGDVVVEVPIVTRPEEEPR